MRGILDGMTIWLELNVSFATGSNTDFNVLLKIENTFIIENTWQYKIMNNKPIQMPSKQAASPSITRYALCVLKCAGPAMGSCLIGCGPSIFDKHLFITCIVGCLPGVGVAVANCIINCI
jgi:hypothetical protein